MIESVVDSRRILRCLLRVLQDVVSTYCGTVLNCNIRNKTSELFLDSVMEATSVPQLLNFLPHSSKDKTPPAYRPAST
jgi:hypothetical protein